MSERHDDTAYVQGYLDRGLPVPEGMYYCPDGVTLCCPDYFEQAEAAGREPDRSGGGFSLSEGPGYACLEFRWGGYTILSGWIAPPADGSAPRGDIGIGVEDCAFRYPVPEPAALDGIGYGVPAGDHTGTGMIG